jgi:hypothetical protein
VPVGDAPAMAAGIERALAGAVPAPAADSWQRFELETVLDQYLEVLGAEPA